MQSIDKTLEIYKNGSGTKEDYSDTDKLLFGLNYVFASKVLNNAPKLPNIDGIISGDDVSISISNLFDSEVIYDTIGTCPNYIYNKNANVFYIKYNCTTDSNISIITYIDKITLENDHYYANVYVGIIDNITNKVYGNIERTRYIETVSNGESYNINDDNKNNFESYTYTFLKKSNDKYIFDSIKKNF
jgi:hypothetical protein